MRFQTLFASILCGLALALTAQASQAGTLTLNKAINLAISANPEIRAAAAEADAEHDAINSSYSLDNPTVGFSTSHNMGLMQVQMGPMKVWSVSQKFKFPTEYFLSGKAQTEKAKAAEQKYLAKMLKVRRELITHYYRLFAVNQILALLKAQTETLQEVARSAEARHAVGTVPQQDELKATEEQTMVDAELISEKEKQTADEAKLNSIMAKPATDPIQLPSDDLPVPELTVSPTQVEQMAKTDSREIKAAQFSANSAATAKTLSAWKYAPNFTVSYHQAYDTNLNAYSVGIGVSIPLWFFAKQNGDYEAASARAVRAQANLENVRLATSSEVRSLVFDVTSHAQLLKIYKTSLIPQASTTLSSSRSAYRAGRTQFLELLDSERSLYAVRVGYYQTLSQYVDDMTKLESIVGHSVSTLPKEGM